MPLSNQEPALLRSVLLGAGLVIIAAGMKAAGSTLSLVLISALLAATLYPVPVFLTLKGMNRGSAIALTAVLAVLGGIGLILVLGKSLSGLSANLPAYHTSLATLIDGFGEKMAAREIPLDEAMKPDAARIIATARGLARAALSGLGYGLFCVVLVILFLVELPW